MSDTPSSSFKRESLPSYELAKLQHDWLQSARSRLLRRANIAQRKRILEIGAGWGFAAEELGERSGGRVTAIDPNQDAIDQRTSGKQIRHLEARAEQLPFEDESFDLVFFQFTLLWVDHPEEAIAEASRVLAPGGAITAIEPDYGGLMEYPPEVAVAPIWISTLFRARAHPLIGREVPDLLRQQKLQVEVQFPDRYEPADAARFDFLKELTLTDTELERVNSAIAASEDSADASTVHLPLWMVIGNKG